MAAEALALRVLAEVNKLSGDATVSSSSLASTLGATQQDVIGALNSLIARNVRGQIFLRLSSSRSSQT